MIDRVTAAARSVYRRHVPAKLRDPLGLARRHFADHVRRMFSASPLPPQHLLRNVQMSPFLDEYLKVGIAAASDIARALDEYGVARGAPVLDFGCGCGRVSRHLTQWAISGCDIDRGAVEWCVGHLPGRYFHNASVPPLPSDAGAFSAVYSVSVFTHLDYDAQRAWVAEIGRVLAPGGVFVFSVISPEILYAFTSWDTDENRQILRDRGFLFLGGPGAFNESAAVHTRASLERLLGDSFEILGVTPYGLASLQTLVVCRPLGNEADRSEIHRT